MKEEILDFIHYGLKTVDLANLNREHLVNCFEELEKENADLEEKISVLLSCKNCPENKGGLICQKEYENKCLAQKIQFIKELQKENEELKATYKKQRNKRIDELQKENAELKGDNKVMADNYSKMEQKFYNNLTKAKEIISEYVRLANLEKEDTVAIWQLYHKAEQFINSEVEK